MSGVWVCVSVCVTVILCLWVYCVFCVFGPLCLCVLGGCRLLCVVLCSILQDVGSVVCHMCCDVCGEFVYVRVHACACLVCGNVSVCVSV